MRNATVQISDQRTAFSPRETISGRVSWELDKPPKSVELRLVWSTQGRGYSDAGIMQTVPFATPEAADSRSFTLNLPEAPYSFSGTLITLTWRLELEVKPGGVANGLEITIAPGGRAIALSGVL